MSWPDFEIADPNNSKGHITMKGTIKAVKRDKGFGFIRDEAGQDRFFHANHLEGIAFDDLQEGSAVEFEPYVEKDKGQRARRVTVVA